MAVALANLGDTPLAYRITALAEADPSCSVLEAMAHPDFPRSLPGVGLAPGVAHEVQVITVLAWRGEAPPADLAPASGAMVVSGPNQEPLWAFYEPLAAIQAALRHAHPLHGGALARGSGTLMGVAGAVPQLRGLAVDAVGEGLVLAAGGAWMLSPDLAMREELRLHMMLAAWTELGEDPAGWVAFAPQAPPEVGDAMLMPLSP